MSSQNSCVKVYNNYGSYLRSRGFDKTICDYEARIDALEDAVSAITGSELTLIDNQLTINGRLDMSCNEIIDVSYLTFCDGTYIGPGASFDISTNETIKLNHGVSIDVSGNLAVNKVVDGTYNFDVSGTAACSGVYTNGIIAKDFLDIVVYNDLNINSNNLEHIVNLGLIDNSANTASLNLTDISSTIQNTPLLGLNINSSTHPISICRQSIYYNDVSYNIPNGGSSVQYKLGTLIVNQMNLTTNVSDHIIASNDISGQFVELYVSIKINATNNNTSFNIDISGIDIGNIFNEVIDTRSVTKTGIYRLGFGPIMILPSQFSGGNEYIFTINNNGTAFDVVSSKLVIKSYYM